MTRWLWLVTVLLLTPILGLGHVLDDLQQQAMVRGTYDSAVRSAGELYCFSLGPGQGIDPSLLSWWDDADSRLCFLRPLSSWSLWLDHKFFWEHPALTHLQSLLWFMGLWLAWRRIFLRALPVEVANLALLLVAASGFVSLSTAWIAARHVLVGGCLSVWGLAHCIHGRGRAQEWLGLALLGVSLLASEMSLGVFGFLVAYEWFDRTRTGRWARIGAYALVGLTYVGVHAKLGYGARHYPMYLDPFGSPLTFIAEAPQRLLALSGELVMGLPSEFWLYPAVRPFVAALSVIALLVLAAAVRGMWHSAPETLKAPLRWLSVGALLSLAPCVSGMQGGRSLAIAGFPLLALIAACLLERAPAALPRRALAAGALIGNPIVHVAWFVVVAGLDRAGEKAFDKAAVGCAPASDVYLIDASQMGAAAWYARYWLKDELGARNFRQLTMIPTGIDGIELSRTGTSSLALRAVGGPLVGPMAVPPGSEGQIPVGFARRYEDYKAAVKQPGDSGPTEVEFGFSQALDASTLCLFVHDDVRLYQIAPPAVGGSLTIRPDSPL